MFGSKVHQNANKFTSIEQDQQLNLNVRFSAQLSKIILVNIPWENVFILCTNSDQVSDMLPFYWICFAMQQKSHNVYTATPN